MVRVAVLDEDRCRPKDCGFVCKRFCPPVRSGIEAIEFDEVRGKPVLVERLCVGCGICVRKCPFKAISIVNLADELETDCSHRFGVNAFKLYRLPIPLQDKVIGLVGKNGIGKTTALRILAGEVKPNLGRLENPPSWEDIIEHYRGSLLQNYLGKLRTREVRVSHKPQYVDKIPRVVEGRVYEVLEKIDETGRLRETMQRLDLQAVKDREIRFLSGGELQRVAIAATCLREANLYLFDEPSSYLDVRQRLEAAKTIRALAIDGNMVVISEHDLAILDYLSDYVCVFYGNPGVYGVISHPHAVREGINVFLNGYIPDENLRFRAEGIRFHVKPPLPTWFSTETLYRWEAMEKSFEGFRLTVDPGEVCAGEVIGILGPNGIGKTTFARLLAGLETPDGKEVHGENRSVSYKPQYISTGYEGTVESLLKAVAAERVETSFFKTEILTAFSLEKLMERELPSLSGGELQRVAIAACLSKQADIYLLDEPSAYMDVEERYAMTRVVRRIVENLGKAAFFIEHDIVVQDFAADKLMVFKGKPGERGYAEAPKPLRQGMNMFLSDIGVTFRRDNATGRPRVNKDSSRLDKAQKASGEYYYISS